jgi:hypothetical protein
MGTFLPKTVSKSLDVENSSSETIAVIFSSIIGSSLFPHEVNTIRKEEREIRIRKLFSFFMVIEFFGSKPLSKD